MKKLALLTSLALFAAPQIGFAADHGDSPSVRLHSNLDINDVYLFQSPVTSTNTVIAMTVSPIAGITGPLTFATDGTYELVVDNTGDAKPDIVFTLKFGKANSLGVQKVSLFRANGSGKNSKRIASGNTGADISVSGGGSLRADDFDDPFFFDLLAFRNGLAFACPSAGTNFFKGLNTLAIVLEVPTSSLEKTGSTSFGVWGRTFLVSSATKGRKTTITTRQLDRMGRPTINTVLVAKAKKDKFNAASPVNDKRDYEADAIATMVALGNTQQGAQTVGDIVFPDILTYDASQPTAFPNGRALTDDVVDTALHLVSGNNALSDCVSVDSSFGTTFPYLAAKNP